MTQTRRINLIFLLTVITYIAGSLLLGLLFGALRLPVYMQLAASQIALAAVPFVFSRRLRGRLVYPNRRNSLSGLAPLCLIGIAVCMFPLLSLVSMISSLPFGNRVEQIGEAIGPQPFLISVLYMAALPAVTEEFVFRGIFYKGLRRHGAVKAALVSSFFFALMHLNLNQFAYALLIGFVLAAAVEVTGTVTASVIIHFCLNFPAAVLLSGAPVDNAVQAASAAAGQDGAALLLGSRTIMLSVMVVLFFAALIMTPLLYPLFRALARTCDRTDYLDWVRYDEPGILGERGRERIMDVFFVTGTLLCLGWTLWSVIA